MNQMWKDYASGRHRRLTDLWCERLGMQTRGFHRAVRERLMQAPWREEGELLLELFERKRYLPDGFSLRVEGTREGWGHPVLVLTVLEVTVTHPTAGGKLDWYHDLWWAFDETDRLALRVLQTNGAERLRPIVDEDKALEYLMEAA